jgi:hypothetical protein
MFTDICQILSGQYIHSCLNYMYLTFISYNNFSYEIIYFLIYLHDFFYIGADLNTNFQLIRKEKTSVQKRANLSGRKKIQGALHEVFYLS